MMVQAQPVPQRPDWQANAAALTREFDELRQQLDIPGLALAVVHDGEVVVREGMGLTREGSAFTTATPLRFASVTKSLAVVLVLQAVERGGLALSDPVRKYIPEFEGPAIVTIRHLLTHTSEGVAGEEYVYGTSRYALLGRILEAASGRSFEPLLREDILEPAGMAWYASPHLGAHAGLVSTVDDFARYAVALDEGRLLGPESMAALARPSYTPTGRVLPVSLGWFTQEIQGHTVTWSFGQDDPDHSGALFLRVPGRKLTLVLLANSNVVSDPFRLLMGDVRKSPFAMAFLRTFVFSEPGRPLPSLAWLSDPDEVTAVLDRLEPNEAGYVYADELLGHAIVRLWNDEHDALAALFTVWMERYPERAGPPDPVVLFFASVLPQEPLLSRGLMMAEPLLAKHPNNRWILLSAGELYWSAGREEEAVEAFERILSLPDQEPDYLHKLFGAWSRMALARYWTGKDTDKVRAYLEDVITSGVRGETLENAERLLNALSEN